MNTLSVILTELLGALLIEASLTSVLPLLSLGEQRWYTSCITRGPCRAKGEILMIQTIVCDSDVVRTTDDASVDGGVTFRLVDSLVAAK